MITNKLFEDMKFTPNQDYTFTGRKIIELFDCENNKYYKANIVFPRLVLEYVFTENDTTKNVISILPDNNPEHTNFTLEIVE